MTDPDDFTPPIMRGWVGKTSPEQLEGVEKRLLAEPQVEQILDREAALRPKPGPVSDGGSWGLLEDQLLRLENCFPPGGGSPFRGRLSGCSGTLDFSVKRFFADADDGRRAALYVNETAGTCILTSIAFDKMPPGIAHRLSN